MIPSGRRASLARHHSVTIAVSGSVTISAFVIAPTLLRVGSQPFGMTQGEVRLTPVAAYYRRHTLWQMFAAGVLRRVRARLSTITALRKESLSPRVLVVSNVASFGGGGGAVGICEIVLALREKRPDLDVVAVYPWKGELAAECARYGIRTKIAWIPVVGFPRAVAHATH